jgi:hypothetical protein
MITASFDLYGLLVENVFGNLLFTIIALTVILVVIGMMSRMSLLMIIASTVLFLMVMMIGFFGSLFAVLMFTFSAIYFFSSIIPWIRGWIG